MTIFSAMLCSALLPVSPAEALDIARQALRDGLWDIVRLHTSNLSGDEALLMTLESYAREGNWDAVLQSLDSWPDSRSEAFVYYRAAALTEKRDYERASALLNSVVFGDPARSRRAIRLRSRIAAESGDMTEALKLMESSSVEDGECDAQMFLAELRSHAGDGAGARELWLKVVGNTNASVRAQAAAAANLGDAKELRRVYAHAFPAPLKRKVGIDLGMALLKDPATAEEGVRLVRETVRDSPDTAGADDAFLAVADWYTASSMWKEAADAYRDAVEIWPALSKRSAFHLARGAVWLKLSEAAKALSAFDRAFETAASDEDRAAALVKRAEALAASGSENESFAVYRTVAEKYPATRASRNIRGLVAVRELENRGRRLYREFQFEEAQKIFASVSLADPSRKPRMDYLEVLCRYGRGLDDSAESGARRLMAECKDKAVAADAACWLAKLDYNNGRWSESSRLFLRFAEMQSRPERKYEALLWASRAAFAGNDCKTAIQIATRIISEGASPHLVPQALMVQGESLMELARFDEAVLVFGRVLATDGSSAEDRLRARVLRADALYAIGADNPVCYRNALESYREVLLVGNLDPSARIVVSFKIARTLDKMNRQEEAVDQYYSHVVLAYRRGRIAGERYSDEARAAFSRAAFALVDVYERRGLDSQALNILELVAESDVPAAREARRKMEKISTKGGFL